MWIWGHDTEHWPVRMAGRLPTAYRSLQSTPNKGGLSSHCWIFPGSERAASISTHTPGVLQLSDNQRTEGDSTGLPGATRKRWSKVETVEITHCPVRLRRALPATSHSSWSMGWRQLREVDDTQTNINFPKAMSHISLLLVLEKVNI